MRQRRSLLRSTLTFAIVFGFAIPASHAGNPKPLTQCDLDVSGNYYLPADLDCTGVTGFGVNLHGSNTRLELRGYAIRNASHGAVQCWNSCSIEGPGTIENNGSGIRGGMRTSVSDLVIRDNGGAAVEGGNVRIANTQIEGSYIGVSAGRSVRLIDSTVTGAGGTGVRVGDKGVNSTFRDPRCRGRILLENSTVTGNVVAPQPTNCTDEHGCADIQSCLKPRLDETSSCGTSVKYRGVETWDACTLD